MSANERRGWVSIALVAGVALAASVAGVLNGFAFDDLPLIDDNARIQHLGNWLQIVTSPYWPAPWSQDLYRPITALLSSAEYALGHGEPLIFRLTSYLLYAALSVGVYQLADRVLTRPLALLMALLFAAHPVHVEAVALGAGQSELLVSLVAVIMTGRYVDLRRRGDLAPRDWAFLGGLYVVASLSKEQGLVLPALLLAVEGLVMVEPIGPRVRRLLPGYLFLALLGALVLLARRAVLGGGIAGTFTAEALQGLSAGGRALTMLQVVPQWARLLVWPAHLQSDYSSQEIVPSAGFGTSEALGLTLLLVGVAAAWSGRRRFPVVSLGLAWMAIAFFPVSNVLIPTGILLAERTLLLPSIGFVLAAGGLVVALRRDRPMSARTLRGLRLACAVLVLAGVVRSAERQRVWRNEAFFAVRSVQDAPRSFRTQRAYGDVLFRLGKRELALDAYHRALTLAPNGSAWQVRNEFARRFRELDERLPEAEQLEASLAERPTQENTRGYLVVALLALGRYAHAAAQADSALARGPAQAGVFRSLRALADSATRVAAPPGSIKIRIATFPTG